jgi:PTH1 family peptidyl-tRNA hydrolase
LHLIVGLGNPGPQYAATRHNAGFMAVDRLASATNLTSTSITFGGWRQKFGAECAEIHLGPHGQRALLLKPMRFMNCSGQSVAEAIGFYKIDKPNILVLVDDYALPLGAIRLRERGGHGGHNGLRDIDRALGTQEYARLRLGIDPPPPAYSDPADWVLGTFTPDQRIALAPGLTRAAEAAVTFVTSGLTRAMNTFNAPDKPAKPKPTAPPRPTAPPTPPTPSASPPKPA